MTDQPDIDIQFYQMILSLQAQAWQSLGKVASPGSGKIERDLEQAKFSIDMIEMLGRKTEGNLSEEEKRVIDHALYELRMNFMDEQKKGDQPGDSDSAEENQPENAEPDKPDSDD